MLGDLQVIEPCVSLISNVEERIHHAEVEGFAETTGPRYQKDTVIIPIQYPSDEHTLVDEIVVLVTNIPEVLYAYRKLLHMHSNILESYIITQDRNS